MIHVCSLARLNDTVAATGARHVVSLLGNEDNLMRPPGITPRNHLWLQLHDINEPRDGHVHPAGAHVDQLIGFVKRWERASPLVIHCYAGVSRSTAAAFVAVCTLNPDGSEASIARGAAPGLADRDAQPPHRGAGRRYARPQRPDGRCDCGDRPGRARGSGPVPARPPRPLTRQQA